jgi:hypothetical protein
MTYVVVGRSIGRGVESVTLKPALEGKRTPNGHPVPDQNGAPVSLLAAGLPFPATWRVQKEVSAADLQPYLDAMQPKPAPVTPRPVRPVRPTAKARRG